MKIKKEVILENVQAVEHKILGYIQEQKKRVLQYKERGHTVSEDQLKEAETFKTANIVSIANNLLQSIPDDPLNKDTYEKFVKDFVTEFEKNKKASDIYVHAPNDRDQGCSGYLSTYMSNISSELEETLPRKVRELRSSLTARPVRPEAWLSSFNYIKNAVSANIESFEEQDLKNYREQLESVKKEYLDYLEAQKQIVMDSINACERVLTTAQSKPTPQATIKPR